MTDFIHSSLKSHEKVISKVFTKGPKKATKTTKCPQMSSFVHVFPSYPVPSVFEIIGRKLIFYEDFTDSIQSVGKYVLKF